jgi:hypothetical protein
MAYPAHDRRIASRATQRGADVRKGRHRRFEEARALKRLSDAVVTLGEPCVECGAGSNQPCASWCLGRVDDEDDDLDDEAATYEEEDGPAAQPA